MSRFVIGLAGGTGSGKTTVARNLIGRLALDSITVFQQDAYYRDLADLSPAQRTSRNFDHPDSIEIELFVDHLRKLKDGLMVEQPVYDCLYLALALEIEAPLVTADRQLARAARRVAAPVELIV